MTRYVKKHSALLIGILILGFILRFHALNAAELSLDECLTRTISHFTDTNLLINSESPYGYVELSSLPVHYLINQAWQTTMGRGDFEVRMLTVMAGCASLLLIYLISRKLFNEKTGLLASAIAALSSELIKYSRTGGNYSLFLLFSLLSIYFFIKIFFIKKFSKRDYAFYCLFTAVMLGCHYFGALLIFAQGVFVLIHRFKEKWIWLLCQGGVTALLSYWPVTVIPRKIQNHAAVLYSVMWISKPTLGSLVGTASRLFTGSSRYPLSPLEGIIISVLIVVMVFALIKSGHAKSHFFSISMLAIWGVPLTASLIIPNFSIYHDRFFILLFPWVYISIASLLSSKRWIVIISLLILGSLNLTNALPLYQEHRPYTEIIEKAIDTDINAQLILYPPYYSCYTRWYFPSYHQFGRQYMNLEQTAKLISNHSDTWYIFTSIKEPGRIQGVDENLLNALVPKNYSFYLVNGTEFTTIRIFNKSN